jgi:predicted nucleic acid-binding protein
MFSMPEKREIVINTGPLLASTAAGRLDVLPVLFSRILVSAEVEREIAAGGRTQFAVTELSAATWLEKRSTPTPLTPFLTTALDPGEASVIALALAEKIPTVCIDETSGRRLARLHGLAVTGSLGILIQAKQQGMPVKLRDAIQRVRQRGIWMSDALEAECLRLAGE